MALCSLGVGCDEYGVCYAEKMGEPGQCGRPDTVVIVAPAGSPYDLQGFVPDDVSRETDSRDENGKYCGLNEKTGEFEPSPPDLVGYCGPACEHCVSFPVYVLQNDVWVCAADYEPGDDR
jgi:hypothetical protein